MRLSRYFKTILTAAFSLLLLCAAANALIDPYRLFGFFEKKSVNDKKPRPFAQLDLIKLSRALAMKPDCLILGNSRADIGFDPQHSYFSTCKTSYNLAVPGMGTEDVAAFVRVLRTEKVSFKKVVFAIDYFDFMSTGRPSMSVDSRMSSFDTWARYRLLSNALITSNALNDSAKTLMLGRGANAATVRADGLNPFEDYVGLVATEGHFDLFRQRGIQIAKRLRETRENVNPPSLQSHPRMRAFEELLSFAKEGQYSFDVVVYPYHAQIHQLMSKLGHLESHEYFKSLIEGKVAAAANAGAKTRFFDFSVVNSFTAEGIPVRGDVRTKMNWFWEAGHFKKELGDVLLNTMSQDSGAGTTAQPALAAWPTLRQTQLEAVSVLQSNPSLQSDAKEILGIINKP
jgi:hypothetical protein